jgi:hypothetical protein
MKKITSLRLMIYIFCGIFMVMAYLAFWASRNPGTCSLFTVYATEFNEILQQAVAISQCHTIHK